MSLNLKKHTSIYNTNQGDERLNKIIGIFGRNIYGFQT